MHTQILDISIKEDLDTACTLLGQGKIVAFPTETVYGLGANALDPDAIGLIYAAKGRPSDNPLIVHIASLESIPNLVLETESEKYKKSVEIGRMFWPGPISILFPKAKIVPDRVTGNLPTVVLRMPSHPIAHQLLSALSMYPLFYQPFLFHCVLSILSILYIPQIIQHRISSCCTKR